MVFQAIWGEIYSSAAKKIPLANRAAPATIGEDVVMEQEQA